MIKSKIKTNKFIKFIYVVCAFLLFCACSESNNNSGTPTVVASAKLIDLDNIPVYTGETEEKSENSKLSDDQKIKLEFYIHNFEDDELVSQDEVLMSIKSFGEPAIPYLMDGLNNEKMSVQICCIKALGKIQSEKSVQPLINLLNSEEINIKVAAIEALGELNQGNVLNEIMKHINDYNCSVKAACVKALGDIGDQRGASSIISKLNDNCSNVRTAAAIAVGQIGARSTIERLKEMLGDSDYWVRVAAKRTLKRFGIRNVEIKMDKGKVPRRDEENENDAGDGEKNADESTEKEQPKVINQYTPYHSYPQTNYGNSSGY